MAQLSADLVNDLNGYTRNYTQKVLHTNIGAGNFTKCCCENVSFPDYGIGVNLQVVWNLLCLCGMGDNPTIFLSERICFIPPTRENAQQRKTQWRQQSDLPWSFYVPAEGSALVNLKHRYNEGPVYRLMIHSPNQNAQLLEPMKMISIARLYLVSFSTDCWLLLAIASS